MLVEIQGRNRLNGKTGVAQVADDAAVALIQIDVGQALNLVAVVTTTAERCEGGCVCLRGRRHAKFHGEILAKGTEASQYRRWFSATWFSASWFRTSWFNQRSGGGTLFLRIDLALVGTVPCD